MKNMLLAAAFISMMTGCSTTTPAINEYTILPLYAPYNSPIPRSELSLKLIPTKSIASLSSKEMHYLRSTAQTGVYLYSRWSDTPASMIDRSLISSLQNRRLFSTLLPATSSASADMTLESDLHAFYHRFHEDGSSEGYIDITYRLIGSKTRHVVASKRFVITSPSLSADAQGGVNALTDATREASLQCTQWLIQLIQEKQ